VELVLEIVRPAHSVASGIIVKRRLD
jgi:hypothetical protein